MAILVCQHCGKNIELPAHKVKKRKYCSRQCADAARRGRRATNTMVTLTCQQCGQDFECCRAWVRRGRRKFCSWDCRVEHQKTLTGEKSARYGIKHTEKTKAKMRWKPKPKGADSVHWKGGKNDNGNGYLLIHSANLKPETLELVRPMMTKGGYILEHRLVMAMRLGRPLLKTERVHHVNGDILDNRPENLMIRDDVTHSRKHREIVRQIGALQEENQRLRCLLATYLKDGETISSLLAKT